MNRYLKILLLILGLVYFISPVDIIPEILIPYLGWIDDSVVMWAVYHLFRYGRMPEINAWKKNLFSTPHFQNDRFKNTSAQDKSKQYQKKSPSGNDATDTEQSREKKPPETPYEILGVRKDASKKDIQKAYKDAVKKYHPDKVSHLGEEFFILANEKFIEIQKAYNFLIKNL